MAKVKLPPTGYFYRRAMQRSQEIKEAFLRREIEPASADELLRDGGMPNMLKDRPFHLQKRKAKATEGQKKE